MSEIIAISSVMRTHDTVDIDFAVFDAHTLQKFWSV